MTNEVTGKKRRRSGVSDEKIALVKKNLKSGLSIREVGRISGVSYYTAWMISKGVYDTQDPLRKVFKEKEFDYLFGY